MLKPLKAACAAVALMTALPAIDANAAGFTGHDLYLTCDRGMHPGAGSTKALWDCASFLSDVWLANERAGTFCPGREYRMIEITTMYTINLWGLPAEYLIQPAQISAAAVFRTILPCFRR